MILHPKALRTGGEAHAREVTTRVRTTGGAQGGRLLVAAGVFTLVNNYLPGSGHLDRLVLNSVGVAAVLLGLICLQVPWERLHRRAPLALAPVAFALISLSNLFGGVSSFSYAVYFVVVFVWVGIAQPPGTAWWLLPVAATAYLLPFLVSDAPPPNAVSSVTVALPVCVLVAEVLARAVRRLEQSQEALRRRIAHVEQLARLATDLTKDLDVDGVQQRLCAAVTELFEARGAVVLALEDERGLVVARCGQTPGSGEVLPAPRGGALHRAATGEGVETLAEEDLAPLDGQVGGAVVAVACHPGQPPLVLCLFLSPTAAALEREDVDVLRLLTAQGTAALTNAGTHAAVVAQREHEQAVVDVLADGVVVLDASGAVVSCNRVAASLLGAPGTGALLGTVPALALDADGEPVLSHVGRLWLETVATRLPDRDEQVVTLRGISRQRALDEAKDLFLATTSHELRTPLTAVKGYVHVLQRRWEVLDDARRLEALGTIAERTDALVSLTDHLLLGARASASRHSAARVPFNLTAAVTAAAGAFADVSERHVVRVCADGPTLALGDPGGVAQVVAQLVENAVKYSPMGGTVEVRVRAEAPFGVVEVLDDGIGLPQDGLSLFAPFYQAGATNTREFGGVGLGLYIVRQLVEAQGGTVRASNRDIGGAVIGFRVPLAGEPPLSCSDATTWPGPTA
jgi:signal transduction histidine kinase